MTRASLMRYELALVVKWFRTLTEAKMVAIERCLMSKQRRSFTTEFMREAAALVLDQGL